MSSGGRTNSVQTLVKGAAILDLLAEHGELAATELSVMLEEPRPTVYRLLSTLRDLGLAEPGSVKGTHRLGIKVFQLGGAVLARFDERKAALPVMELLQEETEQTIFLSVRQDYQAICIERLDGNWVQSWALRIGGANPLHAGAGPRMLLAAEPREFWQEYLEAGDLRVYTEFTLVTPETLLPALEDARRLGYVVSREDVVLGISAIGAPILDHTGRVRAALSMSGPQPAILGANTEANVARIVGGAAEISRLLGYQALTATKVDGE